MRKSLFLGSMLLAAAAHAGEYVADVSLGMSSNAVHGVSVNGEDNNTVGYYYAVPSIDVGIGRTLNENLGAQLRVKTDMYSLQDASVAQIGLTADYALSAAAALTYTSGDSEFYAGPAVQYAQVAFSVESEEGALTESKPFDGFGAMFGVSHRVSDYVGVKMSAQHFVNKQINHWDNELLGSKIGTLKTGVSQLSVSLCTDFTYNI